MLVGPAAGDSVTPDIPSFVGSNEGSSDPNSVGVLDGAPEALGLMRCTVGRELAVSVGLVVGTLDE